MAVNTATEAQRNGNGAERATQRRLYRPKTDIYETEEAYLVVMDLPGVDREAVEITIERNELSISGRSGFHPPNEGLQRVYQEYEEGDFERAFTLGSGVDREGVEAEVSDGVLRVRLPKAKEVQPRRIEVR